jgi:dual specificity MAP kinase phosphatase
VPTEQPATPPPSPGRDNESPQASLLFPPDKYVRIESGPLAVFKIDAADVANSLDYLAQQPLPEPSQVFPWLHGLHPHNHVQQAFFIARRRSLRKTPCCLRGITLVKADGDLTVSRLKGAIAPHEFISGTEFLDVDPREGFSVRNFQIQAAKAAVTSDIIVYGDDEVMVRKLGWDISAAQLRWHERHEAQGHHLPDYNTFICLSPFSHFEQNYPDVVAVDSQGHLTGNVVDLFYQERREMYTMTKASEISYNVWMGPTPDPQTDEEHSYDILIECSDLGRLNPGALRAIAESRKLLIDQPYLEFPSSGSILPPTWSHAEADGILETCKWIWHLSHGTYPETTATPVDEGNKTVGDEIRAETFDVTPRRILIHCADGYTESTMLGIAYFSYSTGWPVPDAWLNLHTAMRRNFFAYPTDVALLTAIAPRLLRESPVCAEKSLSDITTLVKNEPKWLAGLDGSFPSRILDYMYLGNLGHANNPDLLRDLGIRQILSVGETAMWRDGELDEWGPQNVCVIQGVQDNGIDPLTDEFERCLAFIGECPCWLPLSLAQAECGCVDRGRRNGTATLVHCRVGVSRSATICIAEVMQSLNLSFPRAYCFVRARRLNVIIQPHLRFAYELLKWEELLQNQKGGKGLKRELEWSEIAREVALMNRPYSR